MTIAQGSKDSFFKDGENICFVGNSITHEGEYHALISLFYATRFPGQKLSFYNCGISGDVADGMVKRFNTDILKRKPTAAFLMTGMNDILRELYFRESADDEIRSKRKTALENYFVKTDTLAQLFSSNGIRPIYMTPTIYDQTAVIEEENNFGSNDALRVCADHIEKLSTSSKATLIDHYTRFNKINQDQQLKDSSYTIVGPDRIHPGSVGHLVMAYEILQQIQPTRFVSDIKLDVQSVTSTETINCKLSKLKVKNGEISFDYIEGALPFPIRQDFQEALDLVPFIEELNQQTLQISGLSSGDYELSIDSHLIDTYSHEELSNGINLATNEKTPQYQQALEVMKVNSLYRETGVKLRVLPFVECKELENYTGSRDLKSVKVFLDKVLEGMRDKGYVGYFEDNFNKYYKYKPMEDELEKKLDQLRNQIYTINKPKRHTLSVRKK